MTPAEFRDYRKGLRLDQEALASEMGCSKSMIGQIERGLKGDQVPRTYAMALLGVVYQRHYSASPPS